VAVFGKYLHSGALVAAVADDKLAGAADDGHFARVPQLTLLFTRHSELVLELARLLEHLNAMVVSVRHYNVLLHTQTEAVGRVELPLAGTQLSKLASNLHMTELHVSTAPETMASQSLQISRGKEGASYPWYTPIQLCRGVPVQYGRGGI